MKAFLKIFSVSLLVIMAFGCDQGDGRFGDNNSATGWVEYRSAQTTVGPGQTAVDIPLSINVPVYENGLNISYRIVSIEGDYTMFTDLSTNGSVFADPTDVTRQLSIAFPLVNVDLGRDFITIFDIELVAVDADGVGIGVDNDSVTTHRVILPCSNPETPPADFFVGDYTLTDVLATIGPGNGTDNLENGTVTLSVDPANPNARIFDTRIIPAFVAATQEGRIDFSNSVITLGDVNSGIGCTAPEYIFTEAGADNTVWDICSGDDFIIVNYIEDPNASCGGPYPASFSLTKL
jgi:hypothetical protein